MATEDGVLAAREGQAPREGLEEDHADGVEIGAFVEGLAARLLWGQVGEGAEERAGAGPRRAREHRRGGAYLGEAEVDENEVVSAGAAGHQAVGRLEVAVEDAEGVQGGEGVEELEDEESCTRPGQGAGEDEVAEGRAVDAR